MTSQIVVSAPAKVNLALHVTGRRADGYHELDSIVAFADIGDRLRLRPAGRTSLAVTGPFAAALADVHPGDNLVFRAVEALVSAWPGHFRPVAVTLEKVLPVAAGIGGGSADAAALIRGMIALFGPPPERNARERLQAIALGLGADVPVCLWQASCRMRGVGERITPLPHLPPLPAVLVNPGEPVSTARVFSRLGLRPRQKGRPGVPEPLPGSASEPGQWLEWLSTCRNDLEPAAAELVSSVGRCLAALRALPGVRLVRMSGSGATCFSLFDQEDAARQAARALAAGHPRWWVSACRLGGQTAAPENLDSIPDLSRRREGGFFVPPA
jgi:4-diphosphocytidyl-2-C-methyl-D-erythritol kinase